MIERLRPLVPGVQIVEDPGATIVMLRDEGTSYWISVGGTTRTLPDLERRCDERADAAAVSIALILSTFEPAPAPAAPPAPTHVDVELDGLIEGSGSSGPSGGGGARLVVTHWHLGGSIGVGALSPVSLRHSSDTTSITRVPFDLTLRGTGTWGRFELAGELGFAAIADVFRGEHGTVLEHRTGLDLGLRATLLVRIWLERHVAVLAGLEATAIPAPLQVVYDSGLAVHTPYYWLGGMVGLALRGR